MERGTDGNGGRLKGAWLASLVVAAWVVGICLGGWSNAALSAEGALSGPPAGTIGLLQLEAVFGSDACDPAPTRAVPIYGRPGHTKKIGEIVVSLPMVGSREGGCTEREVTVRKPGAHDEALPTLEHSYEMKAAVVLQREGDWCRVKLKTGSAWVQEACRTGFMRVEQLLAEKSLYLVEGAGAAARKQPGAGTSEAADEGLRTAVSKSSPKFMSIRKINGNVWVELEVGSDEGCDAEAGKTAAGRLWLPLRDGQGRLTLWFNSRGC